MGVGFLDELRRRAAAAPESEVLLAPGRPSVTFAGLTKRIGAVAARLADAGLTRDDIVAVVMPDGPELLSIVFGVSSAAICAPVNPSLRKTEIECCLRDLGARALILDDTLNSPAGEVAGTLGIPVLDAEQALSASGPASLAEGGRASDIALLLQTSATTGEPRLVPLTHSNLRAMAANTREILDLTAEDRFLSMMPLFHLTGLLSSLAQCLAGGSVVSTSGFDSGMFPTWIEEFHPTWYTAAPALHNAILPLIETRPDVLDRFPLRFVRSMGAPLPRALLADMERTLRVPVLEGYGLTEAGMVTSNAPPPRKRKPGSVGRSAGTEVAILGEAETFLAAGCEGQIAVRGPGVMHGYRNNAEADQSAFRGGWLLTGDLGYLDDEGFLFVTGRIKDIINRGGEKVLPQEIEEVLSAHPSVSEAVAFGVAHPTLGEDVAAAVVPIPGASVAEPELRRFAAQRLADFKVPRRIVFLDAISKGPTGKARRSELAGRFQAEASLHANPGETLTAVEKKLQAIWKRILRIEEVGVGDDFFEAGGDSLGSALLMAEIEFEFGVDAALLNGSEFFANPTIKTLADAIASGMPASNRRTRSALVALQPLGARIPFFCIPGADENPYYFRDLALGVGQDQPFYALRDPRPLEQRGVYTLEEHAAAFTAAIRSLQPRGPYALGGHCYGGILAFEAARQLVAAGEAVSLLALFEVPTPGYPKVVRHWREYFRQSKPLLEALVRGEVRATWTNARSHVQVLIGLWRRKAQALTRRGLVGIGLKSAIEPMEPRERRNERAGRSYAPKPLRCKVVQFIAADERHSTLVLDDPRFGWRDQVGAGFSVQEVPGIADGIFRHPNVPELASRLRALLDAVNAPVES
jgi:acyl-CoA synthetase (AMP-forming)/AMP-acid ligase II/thioesterase domain-containing protein